ncbi:MAG TPA: monofunctional biosynthetic peptidoglycan transglycosylase [Vicinamibacterales bacterium]|jgi:monofunctional biosynthetic peptidoglycan transglycosylase
MAARATAKAVRRPTRSRVGRIVVRLGRLAALAFVASVLAVLALRWIPPLTSGVMIERRVEALIGGRPYHVDYRWVPWTRMSRQAGLAVIASEDQNFPTHHGFDLEAIQKAIDKHDKGGHLRGASTISQQVAKNVFLWSGRSFVRKGLEAYLTALIELAWPKRRILEVYLNIVELGDGVFGVEAASQRFFRKPAAKLGPSEAALLAAVLPNPIRLRVNRPSAYVEERRAWILQQMDQLGGTSLIGKY